jgi:N-acyl-D-amino-acid deacylase
MPEFDLVLSHARILDGCGNPWYWGDLAINQGHIAAIAAPGTLVGAQLLDIKGCFLTPGFIDIHTHSDLSILVNRQAESAIRQGATTHVIGNCGMSPAPLGKEYLEEQQRQWGTISYQPEITWEWESFSDYLQVLRGGGLGINIAPLVGHGALRIASMGLANRSPTNVELGRMMTLLEDAMQAGAFGVSSGLVYPPGCYASSDELITLCQVVSDHYGFYASHIRGERETILTAVEEAITIGEKANIPVQISHNAPKFGASFDASANLHLVELARQRGQDVTVDNDVHTDLAPPLTGALPQYLQDLPSQAIAKILSNSDQRHRIQDEIVADLHPAFGPVGLLKHAQWQRITMLHVPSNPALQGQTIAQIARKQSQEPFDVFFDLIIQDGHAAEAIFDYIDESNIRLLLQHPDVMISSDGQVLAPYGFLNDPPPYSPCSYGEYPGVLERYVYDQPVLTLQEAIRKMTSFPAQRLGLHDRGVVKVGAWADLVVFDLERVHDRATNLFPHTYPFENYPHQYPDGIDYVLVNGQIVVENGEHTGALPGTVLNK